MSSHDNIKIAVDPSRSPEASLRKFKRLVESAGILREYRKRKDFKKPSVKKKEKLESALKRVRKESTKKFRSSKF